MSRRGQNEVTLKQALEAFLKANHLEDKLNEAKVIAHWEKAVGKLIAKHTRDLVIRDKVLYARVDYAAVKQELMYQKSKLLLKLNQAAGKEVINDIVIS